MADVVEFQSQNAQLDSAIKAEVDAIRSKESIVLPESNAGIVGSYVQKIQGRYNVELAKRDTDNAVDLLYIAYNTTPQEEGDIRVKISALMNKLITIQKSSDSTMSRAGIVATSISQLLYDTFPEWDDIRRDKDQAEIKKFLGKDLIATTKDIKSKAIDIRDKLLVIARSYEEVIAETADATAKSQVVLGARLTDKKALEDEINQATAKRDYIESLVNDLKTQVEQFERKAREYEQRASTAEQRAFVMSIVRVGAQMISSAVPAIAMAAGGPTTMIASSLGSALGGQAGAQGGQAGGQGGQGGPTPGAGRDRSDESARTQTKLAEEKAELKKGEEKKQALKAELTGLEESRKKLAVEAGSAGAAPSKAVELSEMDKRVKAKADDLKAQEAAVEKQATVVSSLQDSFNALDKGLGKLTDEQQQQAASLRDMQMRMVDKAEAYEKERRTQSAELVKITALLKGTRSKEETIHLTIKSLNMSLSALARMKEIVEEIAFFFKSFADFMDGIAEQAGSQVAAIDTAVEMETIRKSRLEHLIKSVDEFFIRQTAQWYAVAIVSDRFCKSFADGWSKLNKLSGDYITGDRLAAYLSTAADKITTIVADREATSDAKIVALGKYREENAKSA